MATEWRVIPGLEDYEVNEDGRVRRLTRAKGATVGQELKSRTDRDGYPFVKLQHCGKQKTATLHALVAMAFLPLRPSAKHEIRHRDGNKLNPNFANLLWGTRKDNEADKVLHGTSNQGERHGLSKLTEQEVVDIRRRCNSGSSQASVAREYGVSSSHVCGIMSGRFWKHLEAA